MHRRTPGFTPERVVIYRELLEDGLAYRQVAKRYNVSQHQIAVRVPGYGSRYSHATYGYKQFHIEEELIGPVEKMLDEGYSLAEISRKYSIRIDCLYAHYSEFAYTTKMAADFSKLGRS